jgi:hypothetical protein
MILPDVFSLFLIDTDDDAGTVLRRDLRVTPRRWPRSKDADEARFTKEDSCHGTLARLKDYCDLATFE